MQQLKEGNERKPSQATLVPVHYSPPHSFPHFIADGESWQTLGARYGRAPLEIIQSNFKTTAPEEVNWYLREYVNCNTTTADRYNWRFSTSARNGPSPRAGQIFIVPNWTLILNAAKKATRAAVNTWLQMIRLNGARVEGSALIATIGSFTSVFVGRQMFIDTLRMGGASDQLAEDWAGFLVMVLDGYLASIPIYEPNAFPIYGSWDLPGIPPPMPANAFLPFTGKAGEFFVKKFFLRTQLPLQCKIDDPAGVDMATAYATWFEFAFGIFRLATVARGVIGVAAIPPLQPAQPVFGYAFGGPGCLQSITMP